MTSPGRRYGLPWRGAEVARTAEASGITAFCSGEFVDHEAYSTLAEMALHTERAQVGPGIAYAFARTPYAHAAGIRGAWRHAPGRVFLGLGSGAYKINRDWFGVALQGVGGMAVEGDPQAYADGWWQDAFLYARAYTIAGGANEVLKTVAAERALGLPRDKR